MEERKKDVQVVYKVGDKVIYNRRGAVIGLSEIGFITCVMTYVDGIMYEIDYNKEPLESFRIIGGIGLLDTFIHKFKKDCPDLWKIVTAVDKSDNSIEMNFNNTEQVEKILSVLNNYFLEARDYELIFGYITTVSSKLLIIKFKDCIRQETIPAPPDESIECSVTNEGAIIAEKIKDGESVETIESEPVSTAEDILKLVVDIPVGKTLRDILKSEGLQYLYDDKNLKASILDDAVTFIVIKRMCKEELNKLRTWSMPK